MLRDLIEKNRFTFHDGFDTWEKAIEAACQPLLADGAISSSYIKAIIENVNKFGPYIVIAPNICIPHAKEGDGVKETAICFMGTKKPVSFSSDPDHDARLFFVLASVNNDEHLKNLSELVEILSDEANVEKLLEASSKEDLLSLV